MVLYYLVFISLSTITSKFFSIDRVDNFVFYEDNFFLILDIFVFFFKFFQKSKWLLFRPRVVTISSLHIHSISYTGRLRRPSQSGACLDAPKASDVDYFIFNEQNKILSIRLGLQCSKKVKKPVQEKEEM